MKHFLLSCDVPNWACLLIWSAGYMLMVIAEKYKRELDKRLEEKINEKGI